MADIFISYAREDRPHAERLALALEAAGRSVWWDRSIPTGKTFDQVIEKAIGDAGCVMVLWSEASVESPWVRAEAQEGADRGVLIPIFVESVKVPLVFRQIQAADFTNWDGTASAQVFESLIDDVDDLLGYGRNDRPDHVERRLDQQVSAKPLSRGPSRRQVDRAERSAEAESRAKPPTDQRSPDVLTSITTRISSLRVGRKATLVGIIVAGVGLPFLMIHWPWKPIAREVGLREVRPGVAVLRPRSAGSMVENSAAAATGVSDSWSELLTTKLDSISSWRVVGSPEIDETLRTDVFAETEAPRYWISQSYYVSRDSIRLAIVLTDPVFSIMLKSVSVSGPVTNIDRLAEIAASSLVDGMDLRVHADTILTIVEERRSREVPAGAIALYSRALLYQDRGSTERARELFERVMSEFPGVLDPEVKASLAQLGNQ